MKLTSPEASHIQLLMGWINSEQALTDWAGPNMRYPLTLARLTEDLALTTLDSFVLTDDKNNFLAFGQIYERLKRCHLGRLIINPKYRGKSLVHELMRQLIDIGSQQFSTAGCSLFVLQHNQSAIHAYQKFGFQFAKYPEDIPLENCLYMTKD